MKNLRRLFAVSAMILLASCEKDEQLVPDSQATLPATNTSAEMSTSTTGDDFEEYGKVSKQARFNPGELPLSSGPGGTVIFKGMIIGNNNCWKNMHLVMTKIGEKEYQIKAWATVTTGTSCGNQEVKQYDQVKFVGNEPGYYYFKIYTSKTEFFWHRLWVMDI